MILGKYSRRFGNGPAILLAMWGWSNYRVQVLVWSVQARCICASGAVHLSELCQSARRLPDRSSSVQ